jgi:glycine dehydrogenase subunit 2
MCQGALRIIYELGEYLKEIGGMDAVSLLPSAGAHGEVISLLMVKKYFKDRGEKRDKVLVPDSAHGTNPASSTLAGFDVVPVPSDKYGLLSIDALKKLMSKDVACLMLTCPNTLGLFEREIKRVERIVHEGGGILYLDGANLNAFLGIARPGDMGFDIVHYNLHKTFSTPHGSGGPGGGGIGVKKFIKHLLPIPRVEKTGDRFFLNEKIDTSIGRIHSFHSNFGVMVKAWVYIRILGDEGLRKVAQSAVLNANHLLSRLKTYYEVPYGGGRCMHEFVVSCAPFKKYGIRAIDIAKRLLDLGFHPPTIYFPLIVKEAFMIEPTETESKDTLDEFADAMIRIQKEAKQSPDILHNAPKNTPVGRLDEVKATRELKVNWFAHSND